MQEIGCEIFPLFHDEMHLIWSLIIYLFFHVQIFRFKYERKRCLSNFHYNEYFPIFLRVKLTILFNQNNSNSKPKVLRSVISLPIFSCSWMPIVRFILNQVTLWMKFKQNCKIKGTSKRNKINSLAYFFGGSRSHQLHLLNQKLQLFCVELNRSWINRSQYYKIILHPILYQKKAIKCEKTKQKYFFYRPFLSNLKTIFLFVIVLALKSLCLLLMAFLQTKILLAR